MIYRIILNVSYYKAFFDFDNLEDAGNFAKTILTHQSNCDDTKEKSSIRMEIIDPSKVEKENADNEWLYI